MDSETMVAILTEGRRILRIEAEALMAAIDDIGDDFVAAVMAIHGAGGRVIITGVGKSGIIARKIASTMRSVGIPAAFMHPVEAFHGDLGMILKGDAVMMLSNSGETAEIVNLVPFVKRHGGTVISMIGNPDSTLSRISDVSVPACIEREACPLNLAPSASTTLMMGLGDAIALTVASLRGFNEEVYKKFHPGGALGMRLMRVREIMVTGDAVPVVAPAVSLRDALSTISEKKLGLVLVCEGFDRAWRLIGIVTDGDVRRKIQAGIDFASISVAEAMTLNPKTIRADALAEEALRLMEDSSITSLAVISPDGIVEGVVHLHAMLRAKLV